MRTVSLFPRRKKFSSSNIGISRGGEEHAKHSRRRGASPLVFTKSEITDLFGWPQQRAAQLLGVSATSLKKICRQMGIVRWPYTKKKHALRSAVGDSSSTTNHANVMPGRDSGAGEDEDPPSDSAGMSESGSQAETVVDSCHFKEPHDRLNLPLLVAETQGCPADVCALRELIRPEQTISYTTKTAPAQSARLVSRTSVGSDQQAEEDLSWLVTSRQAKYVWEYCSNVDFMEMEFRRFAAQMSVEERDDALHEPDDDDVSYTTHQHTSCDHVTSIDFQWNW